MTVQVQAPGADQLAGDLIAAADELADIEPASREVAARIAGTAASTAPRLSGALAAGTSALGASIAVTGIAGNYVEFVRFGTSRMAGRDYITDAIRPDEITEILTRHTEGAIEPLEGTYA